LAPLSGTGAKKTWISTVFSLLFTPLGRYAIIAMLVLGLTSCVYYKIRADAVAEIEAAATADVLRRTRNAIDAADALDLSPDRVREPDKHRRD
jgi:high-affinity K+ transport system ATPase subunit B